jgi:hypothetical protein
MGEGEQPVAPPHAREDRQESANCVIEVWSFNSFCVVNFSIARSEFVERLTADTFVVSRGRKIGQSQLALGFTHQHCPLRFESHSKLCGLVKLFVVSGFVDSDPQVRLCFPILNPLSREGAESSLAATWFPLVVLLDPEGDPTILRVGGDI